MKESLRSWLPLDTEIYKQKVFTATLLAILASGARLLYLFSFFGTYPSVPWQVIGFMLFSCILFFAILGKEYLSLYVGLDKIDLDKI